MVNTWCWSKVYKEVLNYSVENTKLHKKTKTDDYLFPYSIIPRLLRCFVPRKDDENERRFWIASCARKDDAQNILFPLYDDDAK